MNKLMLIGKTGCGKTTLCQVLHDEDIKYKKTQMVEFFDNTIDTPGEYIENRVFYKALIVTSTDCDIIGLVQDSTVESSIFPPGFSSIFAKPVIGIVTKVDICSDKEKLQKAEEFLKDAGVEKVFKIGSIGRLGISELKKYIASV